MELVTRLSQTDCFPDSPESVKVIQTHISIVCLTDNLVYKLKKPVKFHFLDFSTLKLREHFCREELRLNRRLCPDIYLDVVPLFEKPDGTVTFYPDTGGTIVDYAVLMKRLPEELEMDRLLENDLVSESQIRKIARIIANFHAGTPQNQFVSKAGSPENQRKAILDNFLEPCLSGVFDQQLFDSVNKVVSARLDNLVQWLETRAKQGFVVEGHGDLHTGNIFLTDPPTIFDCIEFNPEFRCGDAAVENALLIMDLIHSGKSNLAKAYLDQYAEESGDTYQDEQMPMLISYVAMVRAKVAALSAADENIAPVVREKARIDANRYLQLAAAALLMKRKIVIQFCGLPGGGKSFLCEKFKDLFGWLHLSSDEIRKELAGCPVEAELPEPYYTDEFSRETYRELQRRTGEAMGETPVLADANFGKKMARREFSDLPTSMQALIWIDCDEQIVRKRLLHRSDNPSSGSDAGIEVYQMLKQRFEPPKEDEGIPILKIDGANLPDQNINRILQWLLELFGEKDEPRELARP